MEETGTQFWKSRKFWYAVIDLILSIVTVALPQSWIEWLTPEIKGQILVVFQFIFGGLIGAHAYQKGKHIEAASKVSAAKLLGASLPDPPK